MGLIVLECAQRIGVSIELVLLYTTHRRITSCCSIQESRIQGTEWNLWRTGPLATTARRHD